MIFIFKFRNFLLLTLLISFSLQAADREFASITEEKFVREFPIKYLDATEFGPLLAKELNSKVKIMWDEHDNTLIVKGTRKELHQLTRLLYFSDIRLDLENKNSQETLFFELKHLSFEKLQKQLLFSIIDKMDLFEPSLLGDPKKATVIISGKKKLVESALKIIKELDKE